MSDSILIRFGTQQLDRARETAKQIAAQVRETAKQLKDLPRETRKAFREAARNAARQREEEIREQARRLDLLKRATDLRARDVPGAFTGLDATLNRGRGVFNQARGLAGNLLSGNVVGLLGGAAGTVGPIAAVAATVAGIVLPILRREIEAHMTVMETRSRALQERARLAADVGRRFREDVEFRDEVVRRAFEEEQRRQRALLEGGWRRRGRFTVPE